MAEYPDLNCRCGRCLAVELTGIERAALQPLKERWADRDMENDGIRAYSLTELLDRIEFDVRGEVE